MLTLFDPLRNTTTIRAEECELTHPLLAQAENVEEQPQPKCREPQMFDRFGVTVVAFAFEGSMIFDQGQQDLSGGNSFVN